DMGMMRPFVVMPREVLKFIDQEASPNETDSDHKRQAKAAPVPRLLGMLTGRGSIDLGAGLDLKCD
ncbi:hypothetical protein, partial [Streptomyces rimosus]